MGKTLVRTVISLQDRQKAWLDQQAALRRVSMSSLIRQAVTEFWVRERRRAKVPFEEVLARTAGIWQGGDGLEYQERVREEWS